MPDAADIFSSAADEAACHLPASSLLDAQTEVDSGARMLRFRLLRPVAQRGIVRRLALAWFLSLSLCLLSVGWPAAESWLSLSLPWQAEVLPLVLAPGMLLAILWTLWFGIALGGALALLSALFAAWVMHFSLPFILLSGATHLLALLILYLGYRAVPMRPDLSSGDNLLFFLMMVTVSATFASLDVLVGVYASQSGYAQLLSLWLGRWLGMLANFALLLPLLWLYGRRIERALDRLPWLTRRRVRLTYSLWTTALLLLALLLYVFLAVRLHGAYVAQAFVHYDRIGWPTVALSALQVLQIIHIVLSVLVVFIAYFFYQILQHWTGTLKRTASQLSLLNRKLAELALTDELTGLYNRRHFMEMARRELANAERHGMPCSLLLIDIDHFKQVNDHYGHLAGDQVLRILGRLLPVLLRPSDLAARYGGEELVVLLRHTPLDEALEVAERIRQAIAAQAYPDLSASLRVTVSLGVAESRVAEPDLDWLIERADRALYRAKDGGRNRIECDPGAWAAGSVCSGSSG
ncbi:GGDEF domain-containing protein [Craterilacuibacter sinensis]|uniref:diguanylate cyclase n=1 Tax=Craterilacuibacter sinensis TaxID=2686017 RepID=A0A845BSE6_9NEIS|nr:GGDEF domain-containing protein [Craterilacuibacter sinensis]MXR35503.1 diguanylate cyclase [Craterilacuibacter sinensis]